MDGLDGTKDMTCFSGVYFLLRIMVYFAAEISGRTFKIHPPVVQGHVFLVGSLLIALSCPYKKTYVNMVDSILLSHIATLCYISESLDHDPLNRPHLDLLLMQTMLFFPFLVVFLLTTYRLICRML